MKKWIATGTLVLMLVMTFAFSAAASSRFVGNAKSKLLHDSRHSVCRSYIKRMKKSNKVNFKSRKAALAAGYKSCKKCK